MSGEFFTYSIFLSSFERGFVSGRVCSTVSIDDKLFVKISE